MYISLINRLKILFILSTVLIFLSCKSDNNGKPIKQDNTKSLLSGKWGFTGYYNDERIIGDTIEDLVSQLYQNDKLTIINALIIQNDKGFTLSKTINDSSLSELQIEYPFIIEFIFDEDKGKEIRYNLDLINNCFNELNTITIFDSLKLELKDDSFKVCHYSFGFKNYTFIKHIDKSSLTIVKNGKTEKYTKLNKLP